ncbi:hypothetical protein NE237_018551 [Protea cynaroides]|uniref:Uncharacterized protein n=1 Tax=Protea cynaroides TaxID=273540 RepID=A0A9Q0QP37_9MAGN|nr:hypothetical protein NE237_018551 [Protea cynaroides]
MATTSSDLGGVQSSMVFAAGSSGGVKDQVASVGNRNGNVVSFERVTRVPMIAVMARVNAGLRIGFGFREPTVVLTVVSVNGSVGDTMTMISSLPINNPVEVFLVENRNVQSRQPISHVGDHSEVVSNPHLLSSPTPMVVLGGSEMVNGGNNIGGYNSNEGNNILKERKKSITKRRCVQAREKGKGPIDVRQVSQADAFAPNVDTGASPKGQPKNTRSFAAALSGMPDLNSLPEPVTEDGITRVVIP